MENEETETNEEDKQEDTTTDPVEVNSGGSDLIDEAKKTAERIEKANEELKKQLDRQEKITADAMLGGRSLAGSVVEAKEETPADYAKAVMEGRYNVKDN